MAACPATREIWIERLGAVAMPVQQATRDSIEYWRDRRDRVGANLLATIVLRDPLMCLRVLVNVAQQLGQRLATPVRTVTAALVLMGIEPFFRDYADLPVLEDQLAGRPLALAGVRAVLQRSRWAARLAAAFAIHCGDEDAELLHQAALLDNFAMLLLWCHAPAHALEMAQRQRADPALRSAAVQRAVLGVELDQLTLQLMVRWGLTVASAEAGQAARRSTQIVKLAVQIARHLQTSRYNAALPDDFAELGAVLNLPPPSAAALVWQVLD